ncbi:GNAT family N-acetyltransferase [Kalamiella sp. sgz302252]|uniref:GNAT family N-acetyltransferase n=1 Tax=Pantoea sp. sgz302252 TaxID=3341827 RepID=UPI0036D2AB39
MFKSYRWQEQQYSIITDPQKMDIDAIHSYLTRSSWAAGIDRETVHIAVNNSLSFGLFAEKKQIGFARVITDGATFGYLCDVYILEEWQRQKLSRLLMACVLEHPGLQRLRRIMLVTSTAPWLYEKMGFSPVNNENFVWQIVRPDVYQKP